MLEIKCLYSRKLTGIPLYKYWVQCQIQLEVCKLEYCDFFEIKLNENLSEEEFYSKIRDKTHKQFYGIVIEYAYMIVKPIKRRIIGFILQSI